MCFAPPSKLIILASTRGMLLGCKVLGIGQVAHLGGVYLAYATWRAPAPSPANTRSLDRLSLPGSKVFLPYKGRQAVRPPHRFIALENMVLAGRLTHVPGGAYSRRPPAYISSELRRRDARTKQAERSPGAVRLRGEGTLRASDPPTSGPGHRHGERRSGRVHRSGAQVLAMMYGQQQARRPGEENGAPRYPEDNSRNVVCVDARCCPYRRKVWSKSDHQSHKVRDVREEQPPYHPEQRENPPQVLPLQPEDATIYAERSHLCTKKVTPTPKNVAATASGKAK